MYAVVTIAFTYEGDSTQVPQPGVPIRQAIEMLEMMAMQIQKGRGDMYMRVIETVIKEKQ
jgi:hypothetical protein